MDDSYTMWCEPLRSWILSCWYVKRMMHLLFTLVPSQVRCIINSHLSVVARYYDDLWNCPCRDEGLVACEGLGRKGNVFHDGRQVDLHAHSEKPQLLCWNIRSRGSRRKQLEQDGTRESALSALCPCSGLRGRSIHRISQQHDANAGDHKPFHELMVFHSRAQSKVRQPRHTTLVPQAGHSRLADVKQVII